MSDDLAWRKSSYTGGGSGGNDNCIEIATTAHLAHVRDTKDRNGGLLPVSHGAFQAFLATLKDQDA
ncbi:DUF397 domain-containing protein [Amycolatopsis cihanbeyliensis]|uniref:Uncharacterized protein DUF397 n=1 Tax=Amycolatopsis cihanbeyliensis TaxID=1128664 RepID=A0A542CV19_AMYCI|nr:DUF397 domain-containing protein [Amycolatopsis cihanbeyliensis]TQI94663.1 uncharacterized protein DUF397 [Amycolatopsis cihanbeyliensis]